MEGFSGTYCGIIYEGKRDTRSVTTNRRQKQADYCPDLDTVFQFELKSNSLILIKNNLSLLAMIGNSTVQSSTPTRIHKAILFQQRLTQQCSFSNGDTMFDDNFIITK